MAKQEQHKKGSKKAGRHREHCKHYKLFGQREANKARIIRRHLKQTRIRLDGRRQPSRDEAARSTLERLTGKRA